MNYTKEQLREKAEEFIQETWSKPGMSNMVDMLTDFALSLQEEHGELIELLKSESVYWLLRYGVKSPSKSGMDNVEDDGYYDLYNLVCKLREQPKIDKEVNNG